MFARVVTKGWVSTNNDPDQNAEFRMKRLTETNGEFSAFLEGTCFYGQWAEGRTNVHTELGWANPPMGQAMTFHSEFVGFALQFILALQASQM
jgi:hypothetical protein